MSRAVIVENLRVVDGNVRHALFKVANRGATGGHDIAQQLVCFRYGASGAGYEPRLNPGPRLDEPSAILGGKRPDVQVVHSFGTLLERGFRLTTAAAGSDGAVIFSAAVLRLQSLRPALGCERPKRDADGQQQDHRDDHEYLHRAYFREVHKHSPVLAWGAAGDSSMPPYHHEHHSRQGGWPVSVQIGTLSSLIGGSCLRKVGGPAGPGTRQLTEVSEAGKEEENSRRRGE